MTGRGESESDPEEDKEGLPEVELLKIAREEAHRTIDHQVSTLDDIDDKAARILRLNLLLISILITGLSIAATDSANGGIFDDEALANLWNWFTGLGVAFLLSSTAVAAMTYTASSMRAGMSGRDLENLLDNGFTEKQNLEGIVASYSRWMQYNYKVNSKNAPLGTVTLLLLIYGIVSLSVGVYHGLISEVGYIQIGAVVLVLAGVTWHTGIISQTQRYLNYRNLDLSED